MTTPTAKKNAPTKAEPKTPETDVKVPESTVTDAKPDVDAGVEKPRIPDALKDNPILVEFCNQYLKVVEEIKDYNKEVLAEKSSEWNAHKVLERAREFARPTDKTAPDSEILDALKKYEAAQDAYNLARRSVLDVTAKKLGISLSSTNERDPNREAPLKESRKVANTIGTQLKTIAGMTSNPATTTAVEDFLEKNPLPMVGRDQTHSFTDSTGANTPKYRVHVSVSDSDGNEVISEDGFTKTQFALTKYYERGKAPKASDLREIWEKAGNTPNDTKVNPVEFDDNDMHFVISSKK